jgi:hypothetical protein
MKKEFSLDKFYDAASHWIINYGPRLLIGVAVPGLWVIQCVNRSYGHLHKKGVDRALSGFYSA